MKYVLASALVLASNVPATAELSQRERELWAVYRACVDLHLPDVALHVPSLEEGADLFAGSLCIDEYIELVNEIPRRPSFETINVSERFGQAGFVIKRDTRLWIYLARRDG